MAAGGDPLEKVSAGQSFVPKAAAWNAFIDTTKFVQQQRKLFGKGGGGEPLPSGVILIKNESGSTVERFKALGLSAPIILPSDNAAEFFSRVAFRGVTPTADHEGKWAMALEPIANGKIGRAAVSGTFSATVTYGSSDENGFYRLADISDGNTNVQAAGHGAAEILWSESGSGLQRAVLRLGSWKTDELRGTLAGALSNIGTATVNLTKWNGSAWVTASVSITNVRVGTPITTDISIGKVVWIRRQHGVWWARDAECETA